MQEVIARGGKVFLITNESKNIISENIRFTLEISKTDDYLTPFLMTIPLQLLAYHVASLKNLDIDKPRNLAKSVTVE
jgi:glucosamine--fructose-6-phosphate aminotransferase (isomerizing)